MLVAAVAAAAIVSLLGLALDSSWLAFAGLGAAIVGAAAFALHLMVTANSGCDGFEPAVN